MLTCRHKMCYRKLFFSVGLFLLITPNYGYAFRITDEQYTAMPAIFEYDDYSRCMKYGKDALFCRLSFQLQPIDPDSVTETWKYIQNASSSIRNYNHALLRHGVCIPESCPIEGFASIDDPKINETLTRCYNQKYHNLGLKGEIVDLVCESQDSSYPITVRDKLYAVTVIAYAIFVLFATSYERLVSYRSKAEYDKFIESGYGKFLSAFSMALNWNRLTTVHLENKDVYNLRFMQGIRFYTMICVVIMHVIMSHVAMPVSNIEWLENMTDKHINYLFSNGGYGVQSFAILASFLLAFQFFTIFEGRKEIKLKELVSMFVMRYFRLFPALALVVGFNATWMVHFSRGPFWSVVVGDEYRNCRENWWTNLLYINNFVNVHHMCMVPTWYLAVDTQLFAIQLLVLWYLWYNPDKWTKVTVIWGVVHVLGLSGIIYFNGYEALIRATPELGYAFVGAHTDNIARVLFSVTGNMPGPMAGLVIGYSYYKYRRPHHPAIFKTGINCVIWILVWVLGLIIILGPLDIMYHHDYEHNQAFATVYGGISRTIYAFTMGTIIWGVSQGIGSFNNLALEFSPTYVLGRLTYGALLVHFMVVKMLAGLRSVPHHITDTSILADTFSVLCISYLLALFIALFVELPVTELLKYFKPGKSKQQTSISSLKEGKTS